jgi:hypothetical protein
MVNQQSPPLKCSSGCQHDVVDDQPEEDADLLMYTASSYLPGRCAQVLRRDLNEGCVRAVSKPGTSVSMFSLPFAFVIDLMVFDCANERSENVLAFWR